MKKSLDTQILERKKPPIWPRTWPVYLFFLSSVGLGLSSVHESGGIGFLSAVVLLFFLGLVADTWQEQMGTVKEDGLLIYRFLTPRMVKWNEIEEVSYFSRFILVKTKRRHQIVVDLRFYKDQKRVAEFVECMIISASGCSNS